MTYKVLDLFSGIGGFSLGLERTGGFETVAFCEIEKFPQTVLAKHWPDVPIYNDVMELTNDRLNADGIFPDIITGGFPCQDISVAGNQKGIGEGTRSGLWSECARLVGEIRPDYAIFENVTALLSGADGRWFQRVLWDLSEVGYDAEWHCISASQLGAHHHRDRVWIVAYPALDGGSGECREFPQKNEQQEAKRQKERVREPINEGSGRMVSNTDSQGLQGLFSGRTIQEWCEATRHGGQGSEPLGWSWATEPAVCGMAHGLCDGVYEGRVTTGVKDRAKRLKALGNSVVPQIPELIGRAILEAENG